MEHLGVVDEEELERVCSERETSLGRPLHQWEREIIHHHLRNESLKAVSREERLHIPGFDKVICFSFGSHLLDLLIVKEIKAVRNRFDVLKRRPDFDETILPPRKVARSGAERVQAVCFSWFFMVPCWFFKVFLQNVPAPNCILARRSSLGPPPGGRHGT